MSVTIRTIRGEDFYPALALWNETRRHDPITARFFKRKIFLDVCFDPAGYILAECDGRLCGYIYVVRRLRAQDNDNTPPCRPMPGSTASVCLRMPPRKPPHFFLRRPRPLPRHTV